MDTLKSQKMQSLSPEDFVLPNIPDTDILGTTFVHRAVSITVLTLVLVFATIIITVFFIRIDVKITAQGILEPVTLQSIRTLESGVILEIPLRSGDTVRTGQVIARLDPTSIKNNLIELQSISKTKQIETLRLRENVVLEERQQSESNVQAKARLMRVRALFRKSLADYEFGTNVDSVLATYVVGEHIGLDVAYADIVAAEADIRSVKAKGDIIKLEKLQLEKQILEVELIKNQIGALEERLRKMVVVSPFDGVVLSDQLERMIGTFVREGDALLEVAKLNEWKVSLFVDQKDIHQVKLGNSALIEIPALYSLQADYLTGFVFAVASEPVSSEQQRSSEMNGRYRVIVHLDEHALSTVGKENLKKGYAATGRIIVEGGPIYQVLWRSLRRNQAL